MDLVLRMRYIVIAFETSWLKTSLSQNLVVLVTPCLCFFGSRRPCLCFFVILRVVLSPPAVLLFRSTAAERGPTRVGAPAAAAAISSA